MFMMKIIYFIPAVLVLLFYNIVGFTAGFGSISPWVWVCISILFLSAAVMHKKKWYGCIGGFAVGCLYIYMSTKCTGQHINLETPLGIILCIYYVICGWAIWRQTKCKSC